MQIDRASIFRFGKLADKTVDFVPGINIVYGKNEVGKTTLHAFLTAMLFGLEKGRGRAKGTEGYLRYEPWHAPSYYSGALQFSVGGRTFYLERRLSGRYQSDAGIHSHTNRCEFSHLQRRFAWPCNSWL